MKFVGAGLDDLQRSNTTPTILCFCKWEGLNLKMLQNCGEKATRFLTSWIQGERRLIEAINFLEYC